jgi:PAS domain
MAPTAGLSRGRDETGIMTGDSGLIEARAANDEWLGEILYLPEPTGQSTMIATVWNYWSKLRADRPMPRRADFDPTEIYTSLPYLSVMQYQHEPYRVRFRLVGNEVARLYGRNVHGRFLDEMEWAPEDLADTGHIYERLYQGASPLFGLSYTNFQAKADQVFEWAVFPMSEDGVRVTHALSIDDYTMVTPRKPRSF